MSDTHHILYPICPTCDGGLTPSISSKAGREFVYFHCTGTCQTFFLKTGDEGEAAVIREAGKSGGAQQGLFGGAA